MEQLRHQMRYIHKTEEQVAIANQQLEAVVMENSWYVFIINHFLKINSYLFSSAAHQR